MGLMDKLRDMFTEEVEVEEPIKKEVIQVEIPAPQQKEEVFEEKVNDVEVKKEEKVSAPIFFDDNDFASLEPPKKVEKVERSNRKSSLHEKSKKVEPEKQEKRVFRPTPIISPVYGILDKNYHKEDIKQRNNSSNTTYYNHKDVSIDDIRKKAYGTLEDDLEVTLFGEPEKIDVEPANNLDMFDELMDDKKVNEPEDDSDLFNLIDSMYEKEDDGNGNS